MVDMASSSVIHYAIAATCSLLMPQPLEVDQGCLVYYFGLFLSLYLVL